MLWAIKLDVIGETRALIFTSIGQWHPATVEGNRAVRESLLSFGSQGAAVHWLQGLDWVLR